ncbi:two-component regulator propeller domain-containing protein [Sungkyunkwania multivorans]|uniref:histidine kinase n=1 Tax=Sungkyunkwania multivorans TaxID=1173618 RepID=A0ABW3CS45_9FLAO
MVNFQGHFGYVKRLPVLLIFFLVSTAIRSQIDFNSLEFHAVEKNIFQRPITAMVMDKHGFIWIGTDGAGLYKYNGFSYTYYSHSLKDENSLNSNSIRSLFVDRSGRVWVGTDAGLCMYNDWQNTFKRLNGNADNAPQYNYTSILCFAEYEDRFLVGTYDGVKEIDTKENVLKDHLLKGSTVLDLQFSTKGNLYIATNQGLKSEQYHKRGVIEDMTLEGTKEAPEVTKLHVDERENLWVGTLTSGLFKGDLKKAGGALLKLNVVEQAVMAIASGMDHILVAVENEGLIILDSNGNIVKNYRYSNKDPQSIGSDSVWSILFDKENRLWLGYYENGLGFFDSHHNKFGIIRSNNAKNSIQTNAVKAFAKTEEGDIWIAQVNGIDILNTTTGKITNVFGKSNSAYSGLPKGIYIEDIFVDSSGNTWIATWGNGVFLLKKGSKTFLNLTTTNTNGVLLTNKIRCFAEDGSGNVWMGSFLEGVYYYDPKMQRIEMPKGSSYAKSELTTKDVKVLYHDSNGQLWVGTSSGLYHLERQQDNGYSVIAHSNAISSKFGGHPSSNRILDIFETQDGTLWCGTNGGGLFSYKREEQGFERLVLKDHDLTFVNAIFEPTKNELWLSSKQGVLKIDRNSNEVERFTTNDGLLENFLIDRAIIMDDHNRMYLGTKNGINVIEPQNIVYNPYLAKPYLKDVKLFNKKIDRRDEDSPLDISQEGKMITLKHNQNVLTIDYEAISYTRPEKNQYAYFLEGFEKTWNYVGSKTSATYTNLSSGDYTFRLKAANNDGKWNDASVILKITVLPPWWQTIWAYISYAILLILGILSIMYIYRRRLHELNTYRLERERRVQKEELQQQKLQFFTNISHEFRTPLTLIINPIQELLNSREANINESVRRKHQIIYKNAERLSRLINELMDFRKLQSNKLRLRISNFNLIDRTKNILSFFNEEAKRRAINLDLKYQNKNLHVWADSGMLDKIFFNLLSNAFKVTPNAGRIRVDIKSGEEKVLPLIDPEKPIPVIEVHFRDNGPGIDQKDYKKIFKRFYLISELNKSYYGSTGVGLEMVKSFVELHKGAVEVESELGKGSVFKVIIPNGKEFFTDSVSPSQVKKDELMVVNNSETTPSKVYTIEDILSKKQLKKKLLVVEDNLDLQDYLTSILEDEYELIVASDGQEGWLKTMEQRPDIIISDIIMPIMDGVDFCKKLKGDPSLSHIPVVMLSAKDLAEDRISAREAGAEAYLTKPFSTKELKLVLDQLIKKSGGLKDPAANRTVVETVEKDLDLDNEFIQKVVHYIQDNIENPSLNVEKLSSHLCLSRSQVYRKIKLLTNLSPIEFIRRVRLERSRTLFQNDKNLNVSEVAHKVGFLSASYFTVCYKKQYGELPKKRR